MDPKTLYAYSLELVKLLAFLLRPSESYTMELPQELITDLQVLRNFLIAKDVSGSVKAIHKVCFVLWHTEWDEDFAQTMMDPTVRCMAFSQLKQDGGFKNVTLITPDIAKFEYLLRLTYVFEIWRIRSTTVPVPRSCDLAKRFSRWFTETEPSTFHTLRTLQHLGSSIAYSTMALPKVWWPEPGNFRVMLYLGHLVRLDDFGKMLSQMEQDMVCLWEKDVLLGFKLGIKYSHLVDNLSNTDVGHSLFSDARNMCFQDASTLLHSAIIQNPTQRAHFIKGYTYDGRPIWNTMALRKWLMNYAKFEQLVLAKAEMTAGSASRGTEINCLTWKNTRVRPSRGLFMMGKYLAYLCQYHKGSAMTLQDKMIPHAFDAHTSDMLIQHLAIARPFAQFAAYVCFPDQSATHQLYDSQLFANFAKPFTTTDITACLQKYTMTFIGMEMGVQDWRHVSIGFRRKLSTAIEDLIRGDESETIAASQAHHSRRTENRIYAISSIALASGNADDIFPLYLKHSTDWQEVCGVQRGGTLEPHEKCLAKHIQDPEPHPAQPPPATSPQVKELLDLLLPAMKTMIQTTVEETVSRLQVGKQVCGWLDILFLFIFIIILQQDTSSMEHIYSPSTIHSQRYTSSMELADEPLTPTVCNTSFAPLEYDAPIEQVHMFLAFYFLLECIS